MEKATLKEKALTINDVVNKYFQSHPSDTEAKPKDLMESLIKAGIFKSDHREGLPLRNILRELDKNKLLHLMPLLRVDRKSKNRLWYFSTARHFDH
jgi:uncharacterized protein (DUF2252 family)